MSRVAFPRGGAARNDQPPLRRVLTEVGRGVGPIEGRTPARTG